MEEDKKHFTLTQPHSEYGGGCPVTEHHHKSLALPTLHPAFRSLCTLRRSPTTPLTLAGGSCSNSWCTSSFFTPQFPLQEILSPELPWHPLEAGFPSLTQALAAGTQSNEHIFLFQGLTGCQSCSASKALLCLWRRTNNPACYCAAVWLCPSDPCEHRNKLQTLSCVSEQGHQKGLMAAVNWGAA